jgi:hypothetical protein
MKLAREMPSLLAMCLVLSASYALAQDFQPTIEDKVNRPGFDFQAFNPPGPDQRYCMSGCLVNSACRSWVYQVPQSTADGRPLCWLKFDAPGQQTNQPNFSAGVVRPVPAAETGVPNKISYRRSDVTGDVVRAPNNVWQETISNGNKFNFRVALENRAEILLYDVGRDVYFRADLVGKKMYVRNGRAAWSLHSEIVGTE